MDGLIHPSSMTIFVKAIYKKCHPYIYIYIYNVDHCVQVSCVEIYNLQEVITKWICFPLQGWPPLARGNQLLGHVTCKREGIYIVCTFIPLARLSSMIHSCGPKRAP